MNNYKKKILYIITKSNWGGAQRNVFDLATNIPGDKFEVLVAVGGNGPLVEKLNQKNIKTISINGLGRDIKFFSDIKAFFSIIKIIRISFYKLLCPKINYSSAPSSQTPLLVTKNMHSLSGRFGLSINFATLLPFFPRRI